MTRTHTATTEIRRWKALGCTGCSCRFAYFMSRKVAYGGSTPERAAEKAEAAAQRAMVRDIDRQPCPNCGLYQPDMVAQQRRSLHALLLPAAALVVALLAMIALANLVAADRMLLLAMSAAALIGTAGYLVDLRNPNRNLEANRAKAREEVAAGRVRILEPGLPLPPGFDPPSSRPYGVLACGLLIVALTAFEAPELLRRQAGWQLNAATFPPVVGPGDTVCIYLPDSITSIKGYWTGDSRVTARLAEDSHDADIALPSNTQQTDWGNSIHVKRDERAGHPRLWVRMRMPLDSGYAGKTLACDIDLAVQYPAVHNEDVFIRRREQFREQTTLQLAAPLAGHHYQMWCWSGFGAGFAFLLATIGARLLGARALARAASPGELLEEQPAE